jgi:PAS domain S-box-containing protein
MLQVYPYLMVDHDWPLVALAGVVCLLASATTAAALIDLHSKRKLQQQKVQLDTALETMSQGLCMFDADGRIVLCNDRYAAMMGLPTPSLKGLSLLDLLIRYRNSVGEDAGDAEQVFGRILADAREGKQSTKIIKTSARRTLRVSEATNTPKLPKSVTWISVFHGARQIPTLSCTGCIELDYCIELIVASVTRPKVANFIATEAL